MEVNFSLINDIVVALILFIIFLSKYFQNLEFLLSYEKFCIYYNNYFQKYNLFTQNEILFQLLNHY